MNMYVQVSVTGYKVPKRDADICFSGLDFFYCNIRQKKEILLIGVQ